MPLKEDEWLSSLLGVPAFHFNFESDEKKSIPDFFCQLPEKAFVDVKVLPEDVGVVRQLEAKGFHLIDTNIQLLRQSGQFVPRETEAKIRFAESRDAPQVGFLAETGFSKDRFHLDQSIPTKVANAVKRAWAENFFNGRRGNWMVVAEVSSEICGFLLLLKGADGELVIDLIAVSEAWQGQKIGSAMIGFALSNIAACGKILVGTQLANLESLSFYQALGFHVTSGKYVLHFHQDSKR